MKPVVLTLIIALFGAALSLPSAAQDNQKRINTRKPNYSLKSSSYMMGRYSRMLSDMISGALRMDLTTEQKTKVNKLRAEYLYPMSKQEKELRSANFDIMKMLEDPAFDPSKVKEEIAKSNELDKKLGDLYVESLVSLREAVGKEKYGELSNSVARYRDNLVQIRKSRKFDSKKFETQKKLPALSKTPAPTATEL